MTTHPLPTTSSAGTAARVPAKGPKRSFAALRVLGAALGTTRGRISAGLTLLVLAIAFLGPLVPGSPTAFAAPPFSNPSVPGAGLLGTDVLGQSVLFRVLHGGQHLMLLAFLATVIAVGSGAVIGVVAAYRRGFVENLLMRGVDVVLAIPQLVFALLLLSLIGPEWWLLILAVGLSQAPQTARVIYGAAQSVTEKDFVKAVAVWGVPTRSILARHVLPNLTTPLMVELGLRLSYSIVLIAGLSFLGFGSPPPEPDWGVMVNENRIGMAANPWGVLAPALLLALLAVGTNTFADAIARANLGETRGEDAVLGAAAGPTTEGSK
ncbi:ABC transporter permease [Herbiconiux sp. CPCC 203407]|uniref:ABC transporter permease n=1 Tax=Herbiconiux oxytropis TaxID=2970915 RepID=A0AA41XF20_9MICO|nr:ABC transporter permease [Herbiconiux oxytropis]MCS5721448.1 ABC transporter permease [Herbiconiux oxytropis]MCS5724525.1 ABC transporter permease [Herbiconiux oxytropis]